MSPNFSTVGVLFASAVTVAAAMAFFLFQRWVKQTKDTERLAKAVEQELHIPPTLHPIIDPDVCIGSLSCIRVCPEGDILGIVDGKAALVMAANCIGHSRCELECPVDAIRLVFGTAERGVDLPEVDEFFETGRPGVHIIGELGGMGLIKNAVAQGVQLSKHLKQVQKPSGGSGKVDVVIVGAGPAGIAAALGLKEAGLSFRLVTEGRMGGTIANYPRQKIVMTEPVHLPLHGRFGKSLLSKEELLEGLTKVLKKASIKVEEGFKVTGIDGAEGDFQVHTSRGDVKACKVVLAIGRMGSPRKLGVPGEDLPKVTYLLLHPEQYAGKDVLVVGGGDSALECACMIANETDARVKISYRGPAFGRAKQRNKDNITKMIDSKRVIPMLSSTIVEIRPDTVLMDVSGKKEKIKNDFVIIYAGGVLPNEFLKQLGVNIKRHTGEVVTKKKKDPAATDVSRATKEVFVEMKDRRWLTEALTLAGLIILFGLYVVGHDYYWLSPVEQTRSPLHEALSPGGIWGHGIGVVATLVMLSNFLYPLRKYWRMIKGKRSIKNWLTFHVFVGLMSPTVILFHATFRSNNIVATLTYLSLVLVIFTGLVGRYVYGLIPVAGGRFLEVPELMAQVEQLRTNLNPFLEIMKKPQIIHSVLLLAASAAGKRVNVILFLLAGPYQRLRMAIALHKCKPFFPSQNDYDQFRMVLTRLLRLKRQQALYASVKSFLNHWRVIHVVLAVFLLFVIAAHIYSAASWGYRWIF